MKRTVLIVDHSPLAMKLLHHHLAQSGYEVVTASDGREAALKALEIGPDIVVTDWDMPGMDGVELCRTIRGSEAFGIVYIIIVTAHGTEDRLVEAFAAGADDYLIKPLNQTELLARLRAGERILDLEADLAQTKREVFRSNSELEVAVSLLKEANERLHSAALTDALTGLPNRRAGLDHLERAWAGAERSGRPLSCIMVDIDHFKRVNDTYGHNVGDLVLRNTADALHDSVRTHETVCRLGGEEFLVICEGPVGAATTAAERLRTAVEAMGVRHEDDVLHVTVSLGVAQRTANMVSTDDLISAADAALYRAKSGGRNRTCLAGGTNVMPQSDPGGGDLADVAQR